MGVWTGGVPDAPAFRLAQRLVAGVDAIEAVKELEHPLCDVLWLPASPAAFPHRAMLEWIRAGGRLLLTGEAVRLVTALGLDGADPQPDRNRAGPTPSRRYGLLASAEHPLLTGLTRTLFPLIVPSSASSASYLLPVADSTASVVAHQRLDDGLNPGYAVVWEYGVERGGVLCIGFTLTDIIATRDVASRCEVLFRNALTGGGIPRGARTGDASAMQERRDAGGLPASPLGTFDTVELAISPLGVITALPLEGGVIGGHRLAARWEPGGEVRDVWAFPYRLMHDVSTSLGAPTSVRVEPAGVEWIFGGPPGSIKLRMWGALEVPVFVIEWEVEGAVELRWCCDLSRALPDPAHGAILDVVAATDGSMVQVHRRDAAVLFIAEHATIATSDDGRSADLVLRGDGPGRLTAIGVADESETRRALQLLERRTIGGLARERAQHAAQLSRHATEIETPDASLDVAVEWAKLQLDGLLAEVPPLGRLLLDPDAMAGRDPVMHTTTACAQAESLLSVGARDGARALLRLLSATITGSGLIVREVWAGGVAGYGDADDDGVANAAFLGLAAAYLRWSGDQTAIIAALPAARLAWERGVPPTSGGGKRSEWREVAVAVEESLRGVDPCLAQAAKQWLERSDVARVGAGGLGHQTDDQVFTPVSKRASSPPWGSGARQHASALLDWVMGPLWGITPLAQCERLVLAPSLPAAWNDMAIRRLRIGRTALDLRLRRRPSTVQLTVDVRAGPPLRVSVRPRISGITSVTIDDVTLPTAHAAFEARSRHELAFLLG